MSTMFYIVFQHLYLVCTVPDFIFLSSSTVIHVSSYLSQQQPIKKYLRKLVNYLPQIPWVGSLSCGGTTQKKQAVTTGGLLLPTHFNQLSHDILP